MVSFICEIEGSKAFKVGRLGTDGGFAVVVITRDCGFFLCADVR